jgi:hypothetical protein
MKKSKVVVVRFDERSCTLLWLFVVHGSCDPLRFLYCCLVYLSESHRFAGYSRTYKRTVLHTVSLSIYVIFTGRIAASDDTRISVI